MHLSRCYSTLFTQSRVHRLSVRRFVVVAPFPGIRLNARSIVDSHRGGFSCSPFFIFCFFFRFCFVSLSPVPRSLNPFSRFPKWLSQTRYSSHGVNNGWKRFFFVLFRPFATHKVSQSRTIACRFSNRVMYPPKKTISVALLEPGFD